MRIGKKKRVVTALLAVWMVGGNASTVAVAASPLESSVPVESNVAVYGLASGVAGGCPLSISCGVGCSARLSNGFCVLAVDWDAKAEVGGIQIGPSVRFRCDICECWYIYTSSTGNRVFKRTTSLSCSAGSPDVEIHVV